MNFHFQVFCFSSKTSGWFSLFSAKNSLLLLKSGWFSSQFDHQVLFFKIPWYPVSEAQTQKCFMHTTHCITQTGFLKTHSQRQRVNKINNILIFHHRNWIWLIFFIVNARWRLIQKLLVQPGTTVLVYTKAPAVHPSLALHHQCRCQQSERSK